MTTKHKNVIGLTRIVRPSLPFALPTFSVKFKTYSIDLGGKEAQ